MNAHFEAKSDHVFLFSLPFLLVSYTAGFTVLHLNFHISFTLPYSLIKNFFSCIIPNGFHNVLTEKTGLNSERGLRFMLKANHSSEQACQKYLKFWFAILHFDAVSESKILNSIKNK